MANNPLQFSEVLHGLTEEQVVWLSNQINEVVMVVDATEKAIFTESDEDEQLYQDYKKKHPKSLVTEVPRFLAEDFDPASDMDDDDAVTMNFDAIFEKDSEDARLTQLWLSVDEQGNPGQAARLVQKFLQKFRPAGEWSLSYAETCDKPHVSEYGGGAFYVTAKEIVSMNSHEFIGLQREAHVKEQEILKLVNVAEALGLSSDNLDDHIHNLFSRQASGVNNQGLHGQIEYLMESGSVLSVTAELHEIAEEISDG